MDSMGAAKQNAHPLNFSSWASNRGFGYRTFLQLIHWFSGSANSQVIDQHYHFYLKLIVYISVLICIYVCTLLINTKNRRNSKTENTKIFVCLFVAVFSVSNSWVSLQPDYLAALVGIVIICLVAKQSRLTFFIAGFMIAPAFSVKGVTVLTGLSALAISLIFVNKAEILFALKWISRGIISGFGLVIVYLYTHPSDLKDLMDASILQGTFLDFDIINRTWVTIWCIAKYWSHVPILIMIPIAILLILFRNSIQLSELLFKSTLLLLSFFLVVFQIFIQGSGYGYNLAALIPLAFALIVFCLRQEKTQSPWLIFSLLLICTACASNAVPKYMWDNLISDSEYAGAINSKYRDFGRLNIVINRECEGKILYLDDGLSAYFLTTQSVSRYTHPIQVYRPFKNKEFLDIRENYLRDVSRMEFQCALIDPALFDPLGDPTISQLIKRVTRDFKRIAEIDGVTTLYRMRVN